MSVGCASDRESGDAVSCDPASVVSSQEDCAWKMPHVSSGSGGDDLGSTDEVKVFKDEGEENEKTSLENLTEEKSSLIDLTESEVNNLPYLYILSLSGVLPVPETRQLETSGIFRFVYQQSQHNIKILYR